MTHAALALQKAIHDALIADVELVQLLGGAWVYDVVPAKRKPPYIVFAEALHNDWSTSTEEGMEHLVSIHVWSRQRGRKQVLEISRYVVPAIEDLPSSLEGHHLVNLRHEFTETERDEETGYFVARLNFRAVTEPINP